MFSQIKLKDPAELKFARSDSRSVSAFEQTVLSRKASKLSCGFACQLVDHKENVRRT